MHGTRLGRRNCAKLSGRRNAATILEALPPIAARNASDTGTNVVRYLTQTRGLSVFVRDRGARL
jgi:hypothetical protein